MTEEEFNDEEISAYNCGVRDTKNKVKNIIDNKESDLQRRILNASGHIRGKRIIDEPLRFKQNPLAIALYHHRLLKEELEILE